MRINRLIVEETFPNRKVIRDIKFNLKGCNFIVDDSNNTSNTGNSVGKSTLVKIIDLCLGAKTIKEIYTDSETKQDNNIIKDYLNEKKVIAKLEVVNPNGNTITLTRELFSKSGYLINEKRNKINDYLGELNKIFFNYNLDALSFRQLITKFVRINSSTDEKMLKYLPMGKNYIYDALYCYLFKLIPDDISNKIKKLKDEKNKCLNDLKTFKGLNQFQSEDILKQKLVVIDNELATNRNKQNDIINIKDYRACLDRYRELNNQISSNEIKIDSLNFDINLITNSINKQKEAAFKTDNKVLKSLYDEACELLGKVEKKFNDLVNFHNSMIENKVEFLDERKKDKESILKNLNDNQNKLIEERGNIEDKIYNNGNREDLEKINKEIEALLIEKGNVENGINIWEENKRQILEIDNQLRNLDDINNHSNNYDDNIVIFNSFFSKYSDRLYGNKCVIAYQKPQRDEFPVKYENMGSVGTGEKKGLIAAFDLAYYSFSVEKNITCPKFIILDKMETTDKKQIEEIYKMATSLGAQMIIPILNEKIDFLNDDDRKKSVVLELSEHNKFFKL